MQIKVRYIEDYKGSQIKTKTVNAEELLYIHPTENETIYIFKRGENYLHIRPENVVWYSVTDFTPKEEEEVSDLSYR